MIDTFTQLVRMLARNTDNNDTQILLNYLTEQKTSTFDVLQNADEPLDIYRLQGELRQINHLIDLLTDPLSFLMDS